MIIYTNDGNPLGLKLLMLAKFAKASVKLERVNLNDTKSKDFLVLPTLELDNGTRLFSTAAIAKYLFPNEDILRDEWLEWASTLLAPALVHHMGVGHRADPNALPVLNALARKLDDRLKQSAYLAGDNLTAADIAVWSLLAPEGTLKGAQNVDSLREWYRKINDLPEVQAVFADQALKDLSFSALQNANRYGGLHHIQLSLSSSTETGKVLAETSSNLADTVTDDEINAARDAFKYNKPCESKEPRTVLPKAGERNVLITSALPYVNNVPHLGNLIGCVLSADIFARYSRSVGYNTLYISGTDEYGTATENKALAENLTPQQICDKYYELHNNIYRWFGIGFDYFGRTSAQDQTEIVQEAFHHVYERGYIFTESVDQLLCQKCDRFLSDRFVEGTCPHPGCGYNDTRGDQCDKCGKLVNATELIRPRCKVCSSAPVIRPSNQLFLDLTKTEPQLIQWLETVEMGWSNTARVITRAWLREGLKPRCITRDLKWGIPVPFPGFENKVFYVWFDAPFGYVSMTKHYTKEYKQWWQPTNKDTTVELFQFMAKDNVAFHSVMWPSTLIAADKGHIKVSYIMATEYLNYEDGKFSKSRGIGVFGNDAQETGIPADVWRFYLASARPEGQDSNFSWNDLAARNNSELLNNLGNFVNRALVFCEKNFNSTLPEMLLTDDELILLALINRELRGYINSLEKAKLRDGIRHMLSISRHGNGYMQTQQPWVLLKGSDEQKSRAGTIIAVCANIACLLAILMFPYMPTTARNLFAQLNAAQTKLNPDKPLATILLPKGHKIGKPAPLFSKLEQSFIDELKQKYGSAQTGNGEANEATDSIDSLESAIKAQGEKVRQLKASTKDKTVWQPEVNILLELKKKLETAQKTSTSSAPTLQPAQGGAQSVQQLEESVQRQGEKVRQLKASTKDKTVFQPEVNILLDLKKQLAAAQAKVTANSATTVDIAVKVKTLEEKIAQQGDHVRKLKATGNANLWKPEVDILLALKKELAQLTGAQGKAKK